MGSRYFMFGVVLALLGAQLRLVDTFVLTPKASQFVESRLRTTGPNVDRYENIYLTSGPVAKKSFTPPRWMGWALLSVGGVLVMHGLTVQRIET